MNRRSLMMLALLALLTWDGRLFGQDTVRRTRSSTTKARTVSDEEPETPTRTPRNKPADPDAAASDPGTDTADPDRIPPNFPTPAGYKWQSFSISRYSALLPSSANPQTAVIDWIFRATTPAPWHGEQPAVLCASRSQVRAFNTPKVLRQVKDMVDRFENSADADVLKVRVRFIAASDTRWRYAVYQRLTPVGSGAQGQQIWRTSAADAELVISQMQVWQGFKLLGDRADQVLNGQTLKFSQVVDKAFNGSVQREGAVGLGFQPKVEKLEEGVVLRFSPLLTFNGDALDAALELSTNLVRRLHPTKVLGPREIGTGEVTLDVPEVSETRLNRTVLEWPLGDALIISTGVQPGILIDKGGLFNLRIPGTVPTATELLTVINVEAVKRRAEPVARRPRDRASASNAAPE
jgi:hypothetical protein